MNKFLKIVITTPDFWPNEAEKIVSLFNEGIDYIHLRKPQWNERQLRQLIEAIPQEYYGRLRLHSHFTLIDEYALAGAHLNSRNTSYNGNSGNITRSCHSISELSDLPVPFYQTLSPIFDSISKSGYRSAFNLDEISTQIANKNVIALGGVTPQHFALLADYGFSGAAMLGCIWRK